MGRYDTNSKGIEPGRYIVNVVTVEDVQVSGWDMIELECSINGQDRNIKQRYFPNQLKSMFIALRFAESEPGVFDGDIHEAAGMNFEAELYMEDYDKKDGTKGKARRLRNFSVAPASANNPGGVATPGAIPWED